MCWFQMSFIPSPKHYILYRVKGDLQVVNTNAHSQHDNSKSSLTVHKKCAMSRRNEIG